MPNISYVTTIKERCRVCYTCVRECPAKAIRIADGQAEIIGERCINCGNCVKVCSQGAKQVVSTVDHVRELLDGDKPVAALVAPSFPAEFSDMSPERFVGMLRRLGFTYVNEVAFGADLVARSYQMLNGAGGDARHIASTCPALVLYVEKYYPDFVNHLAPIASPMVATARALRVIHGDGLKMVFIGPCSAKKQEAASSGMGREVDEAITFIELREMFAAADPVIEPAEESDFDPPHGGMGGLFPLSRGILQAAGIDEDLVTGSVVAADGRSKFVEAVKEFASGDLDSKLLEALCCNGCIQGPGMGTAAPLFSRRSRVSKYAREYIATRNRDEWERWMERFADLNLSQCFTPCDQRINAPDESRLREILANMGKLTPQDELNCGACGYETCHEHAVAIYKGLAENEMCLPHTIDQLNHTIMELALSNVELTDTREALIHSEKMASLGQLAAGIAHEVNNPLGVVLMYSHMLRDECADNPKLREDLAFVAEQADRCKKIVAGLLGFARQTKVVLNETDVVDLVNRSLATIAMPGEVSVEIHCDTADPLAELDRDQIIQVVTNLVSNAVAAMPGGGTLTIAVGGDDEHVSLVIADTGCGIPKEHLDKVFEPFFTTKQIGKGTGLGLSVTYGIVKMHNGDITVRSNTNSEAGPVGTSFMVTLPRRSPLERETITSSPFIA